MATVHYQLTHNEIAGTAFRRRMARPSMWAFLGAMLFLAVALNLMGPPAANAAPYFLIIGLVLPFSLYMAISRAISRAPWITGPTSLEFDEKGVRIAMGDVRQEVAWRVFRRWTRTSEHLFLYPSDGPIALTIPLRAFDAATLDDFTRHLEGLGPAR